MRGWSSIQRLLGSFFSIKLSLSCSDHLSLYQFVRLIARPLFGWLAKFYLFLFRRTENFSRYNSLDASSFPLFVPCPRSFLLSSFSFSLAQKEMRKQINRIQTRQA